MKYIQLVFVFIIIVVIIAVKLYVIFLVIQATLRVLKIKLSEYALFILKS